MKRRYDDKKESVKQYIKEKYVKNGTSDNVYKKQSVRKILKCES